MVQATQQVPLDDESQPHFQLTRASFLPCFTCKMKNCLVFLSTRLLLALSILGRKSTTSTEALNVLLIGDSFDRFFVTEWCFGKQDRYKTDNQTQIITTQYPVAYYFGDQILINEKSQENSVSCKDHRTNDSMALVQIFGSGNRL